jgi:tetratricopeptide (TPR) repeat protein
LGDDFDFDLLWASSGSNNEEHLLEQIDNLLGHGLLVENDETYRFVHNLVRRVLYDETHPRRRRIWHHQAALALAHLAPQQIAARARHAYAAQDWQAARDLSLQAADQALSIFASEEAEAFYHLAQRASENLPETSFDTRARWLRGLARVYQLRSDHEAEARTLETWQAAAHLQGDATEEALALTAMAKHLCRRGKSADALPPAQRAVQLAKGDLEALSTALHNLGLCHTHQGNETDAMTFYHQAVEAAREAGATQQEAECLNDLANALYDSGEVERSAATHRRAATLATACGDRLTESRVLNNLGNSYLRAGAHGPARRAYEKVLAAVKALDIRRGTCIVEGNLAEVWRLLGYPEKAYAHVKSCLQLATEIEWPAIQAKSIMNMANLCIESGELEKATDLLKKAHQILPQQGLQDEHLYYYYISAKASLAQVDIIAAAEQTAQLAQQIQHLKKTALDGLLATLEGNIQAAQGDLQAAEKALRRAVQICAAQNANTNAANAQIELGLVLHRAGQRTEANKLLATAWEQIARRMMRREVAHLLERLGHPPALLGQQKTTLPRHDAPLRRSLDPEECITILWTPDAGPLEPALGRVPLRRARLRRILTEAIAQQAAPTIKHLAQALGVSQATLNADLAALRQAGWPIHTRGSSNDL